MSSRPAPARSAARPRPLARLAAFALASALAGCVAPQHAGEVDRLHAAAAIARDDDRSRAARIAAGLGAARLGVSLGCTMLFDLPAVEARGMRAYCAARDRLTGGR